MFITENGKQKANNLLGGFCIFFNFYRNLSHGSCRVWRGGQSKYHRRRASPWC